MAEQEEVLRLERDVILIDQKVDQFLEDLAAGKTWHNAGVELISEQCTQSFMNMLVRLALEDAETDEILTQTSGFVKGNLEVFFYVGYLIGKSPEEIVQCRCEHDA